MYQHNCSGCHGDNADGIGIAAAGLLPKPVNLHLEHFSNAHLATVLWDGVYGSSMPAWRQLEKNDLEDVATYMQALQAPQLQVALSPADSTGAAQIYTANCVSCHGPNGQGNGPAAGALKPSPVNFHVRQPTTQRAWTALNEGIPGSAMPAWKAVLTPDQIRQLIPYVQPMYGHNQEAPTP